MMIGRGAGVRVDVDEAVEPDVEPALLARLADGGAEHFLAAIDVAAGEHPLAVARLDRPPHEHDPAVAGPDDRADRDLRVQVQDEAARGADQPLGLGRPSAGAARARPPQTGQKRNSGWGMGRRGPWPRGSIISGHVDPEGRAHGPPGPAEPRRGRSSAPRSSQPPIQKLIDDMIETMEEYQGIGLAAPQVHESVRLFVAGLAGGRGRRRRGPGDRARCRSSTPRSCRSAREMVTDWEGCLSIPDIRGKVPRYTRVKVRGVRPRGRARRAPARGLRRRASSSTRPITSTASCSSTG